MYYGRTVLGDQLPCQGSIQACISSTASQLLTVSKVMIHNSKRAFKALPALASCLLQGLTHPCTCSLPAIFISFFQLQDLGPSYCLVLKDFAVSADSAFGALQPYLTSPRKPFLIPRSGSVSTEWSCATGLVTILLSVQLLASCPSFPPDGAK